MALSGGRFSRARRVLGLGEGLATVVVVVLLFGAVVYATSRPALRVRFDLTEGARYSLGAQTRKVLESLEEPVRIVTVFRGEPQAVYTGLAEVQARGAEYVRTLLAEYVVAAGGRLTYEDYDPHADQNEVEQVVREFHITRYNVVLVTCGERVRQVFLEDLVTIDRGMADPQALSPAELRAWHAEGPLTSAILSVTDEEPPRAAVLIGHNEGDIKDFDLFGYGVLAEALRGQGFEVRELELLPGDEVPDDVELLTVISPTKPLGAPLTEALVRFHERGGALFLALDPWWADLPLDTFLADQGVLRERSLVTRDLPLVEASSRRTLMQARRFNPDHPATAPIARQRFFANVSTHGGLFVPRDAPADVVSSVLLLSDDDVFGDQFGGEGRPGDYVLDEGVERTGARNLVLALESPRGGRLVVAGGAAWLTNSFLGAEQGGPANMDLALNAMNWLVERERAVETRELEAYQAVVKMYDDEMTRLRVYVIVLMPLAGALLGLVIWFLRRR